MSHDQLDKASTAGAPAPDAAYEAYKADWSFVDTYAREGKGAETELRKHIAGLVGKWTDGAIKLMPDIAKRTRGDIVLECAAMLGMPLAEQLELALHAKESARVESLREYLNQLGLYRIAELDEHPDLLRELRTKLKGPLGVELPALTSVPVEIVSCPNLIEWYLDTTTPSVAALAFLNASSKLATTLDKIAANPKAWGWVDTIQIEASDLVGESIVELRDSTSNAAARAKLSNLANHYEQDQDKRTAAAKTATADLASALKTKADDATFLDAQARTQNHFATDDRTVAARLAGAPANTVIQYLFTLMMSRAADIERAITLLHDAKGATREHVELLFSRTADDFVIEALTNDRTRTQLRQLVGLDVGLRSVFSPKTADKLQVTVVKNEALRHWAYEGATPQTLLWIAAGGQSAKQGCRLVRSERGNGWVKQLSTTADSVELRRFILNTTDAASAAWIKQNILNDSPLVVSGDDSAIKPRDPVIYGNGEETRPFELPGDADPDLVVQRLADLDTAERARLLANPDHLHTLLANAYGKELRIVELLAPTLTQLATFGIQNRLALVDYTSDRPTTEQLVAAQKPAAMRTMVGAISPFIALPALRQPAQLAKALANNHDLLVWIFEDTDASQALAFLARDPARDVAAALLANQDDTFAGLPAYEHLRAAGARAIDRIEASKATDNDTKKDFEAYKSGDAVVDRKADKRAENTQKAASAGDLIHSLHSIFDSGGSATDVIAVVQNAPAKQQIDLLSGTHDDEVTKLRAFVRVGPQHVFPDLTPAQLLSLPSAAKWLMYSEAAPTVLHLAARDVNAVGKLAKTLDQDSTLASSFASQLPHGAALTSSERLVLDELGHTLTNAESVRTMFGVRFDVEIDSSYDAPEAKHVWTVLQRLPPAQVDQNVIHQFVHKDQGGAVGAWGNPNVELDTHPAKLEEDNSFGSRGITMTADEVKAYYKLDDKALVVASDPTSGWLKAVTGGYVVTTTNRQQFDITVIHEVGHSIDSLLGQQTELIYGLAGWKRYGYDQFETWASEFGALDGLSADDRRKTIEVWQQALRSKTAVSKLVDAEHPAVKKVTPQLKGFIEHGYPFAHSDHDLMAINGTVHFQIPGSLASVKKQAWDAAPSDYGMTSPQEYFAECYVEYYRDYDGTKDSEANKGGHLPAWIKTWFDANVDAIRLSPDRLANKKGNG